MIVPYTMYMNGIIMPITPSKVTVTINGQNETATLINGEEVNILKAAGLSDVSFELILPAQSYPFCNGVVLPISTYLALFEKLKASKQAFQWILIRTKPKTLIGHITNMTVSLENYNLVDDADEGCDTKVSINLKQWRDYGTKTATVTTADDGSQVATVQNAARSTSTAPTATEYVTKSGDTLYNVAKKLLGDGSKYTELLDANSSIVSNPTDVAEGLTLTMPT